MKNFRKTVLRFQKCSATLLISAFFLTTISCGTKTNDVQPANPAGPDAAKIQLEFWEAEWSQKFEYRTAVEQLVSRYNSENKLNVQVNPTMISWDGYYEYYLQSVAAGDEPDLCSSAMPQAIQYASKGYALDLTPILDEWRTEESSILEEIDQEYFDYFTYHDKLVGLPFGMDFKTVVYRKDFFEDAGITEIPGTLSDLTDTLYILQKRYPDKVPFLANTETNADYVKLTTFFIEASGGVAVTNKYQSGLDSSLNRDALAYLSQWVQDELIGSVGTDEENQKAFLNDKACMFLCEVNLNLYLTDMYALCGTIVNIAGNNNMYGHTANAPQAYHGFSTTEYPEETRNFLKWLIENNEPLFNRGSTGALLPIRSSYLEKVLEDDEELKQAVDRIQEHGRIYTYPFATLHTFDSYLDSEILWTISKQIMEGGDVIEVLSKADKALQKIMDQYQEP
ncbi:ABC transporter substrate-binding protein [Massiliimalia massiliensis]|uniref:ABC transporter substrate-binding protein n=1 Tax=Massiliimalia massiliensis TaxID=1852384 RepID=UPI0009864584|nr:ABC transporter substrate-binding protein [Massiliimalia massiliensis]